MWETYFVFIIMYLILVTHSDLLFTKLYYSVLGNLHSCLLKTNMQFYISLAHFFNAGKQLPKMKYSKMSSFSSIALRF